MKKIKFKLNKILSVLMAFTLVCVMCLSNIKISNAAETPKGYVTVSMEKFTLGRGYIIEPVKVPLYEGDTGATIITRLMDEKLGKNCYTNTGSINDQSGIIGQSFYLASVKDSDNSEPNICQYILDAISKDDSHGELYGTRGEEEWLGEFDYYNMSGWMYSVNNWFPNYGCGQYDLKDGDVMRWQYTVYGYGSDLGSTFMGEGGDAILNPANKDELTKQVGEINSSDKKTELLNDTNIKQAYDKAYNILEDMQASQSDVDNCLNDLSNAVQSFSSNNNSNNNEENQNSNTKKTFTVDEISDQKYTGNEVKPTVLVKNDSQVLNLGTDYEVLYNNNINEGTATVAVTGINNYEGCDKIITFKIVKEAQNKIFTVDKIENQEYTGNEIKPEVLVKDGNNILKLGEDYNLIYKNNKEVGTATVVITGINSYQGCNKEVSFQIFKKQENKTLTVDEIADQEYTGNEINPKVIVKNGTEILQLGKDYNLTYSNNKEVGTAKVSVEGLNGYNSLDISFKIKPRVVENFEGTSKYSSKINLNWDKSPEASGYKIYRYNFKTKNYDKIATINKNTETSYTDTSRKSATNYYYKIQAYNDINGSEYYGENTSALKVTTKPLTPSIRLVSGSKKITVKWSKISRVNRYEVYRATSKTGTYYKKATTTKISYTNKNLKKQKRYYYKVRAYRIVDNKKVYSRYSTIKSVKAK